MIANLSDYTLSHVESSINPVQRSSSGSRNQSSYVAQNNLESPSSVSTFDSSAQNYFDLGNVFESATDKVRSQVKRVSKPRTQEGYNYQYLDLPDIDLVNDVSLETFDESTLQPQKTDFRVDYFPGWEPIITPSGGRIYTARKLTNKQRALIQSRLDNLNQPKPPSLLERTKSFFFPKNSKNQVNGRIDTTEVLRNSAFKIDSFQFSHDSLYINFESGASVCIETFLKCYAVNTPELQDLFATAKNLLFRGTNPTDVITILNRNLYALKFAYKNVCFDKSAIAKSKLLQSKVSECNSRVRGFFKQSKGSNPNLVTGLIKEIIDLTTYSTATNQERSQASECVDFFLSKCVEGVLESKSTISEKLKSNILFRGFKVIKPKGSMVQEFAYWLKQYALDPTNERVSSMFHRYYDEFKNQISVFLNSKSSNASSLVSALCSQLISSIKK